MAIVPCGLKRFMVAQNIVRNDIIDNYNSEIFGDSNNMVPSEEHRFIAEEELKAKAKDYDPSVNQEEVQVEDSTPDITEYIFNKLKEFGYPPRRLEQFENEFVNEKIYPEGTKEVSMVIPDRYYGMRRRITDKDLGTMISEIQKQFSLSFVDAERKDKKITVNFTSQQEKTDEDEENLVEDSLDEVYGNPTKRKNKNAETLREMIKESQGNLYSVLLKRLKGEK